MKIEGNIIKIRSVSINNNVVNYDYSIPKALSNCFSKDLDFFYQYPENFDLRTVPKSILYIPLVVNVLPLAWIMHVDIEVPVLDKAFAECIENIKNGFKRVYPNIDFYANLKVGEITENTCMQSDKVTCMFTGGVDAWATLLRILDKKPVLINIFGADIKLEDTVNLGEADKEISNIANFLGLQYYHITSSIRQFISESGIRSTTGDVLKDTWWHGAQHSIGMLSLLAPFAYLNNINTCYIASSFTKKAEGKVNCVSYPFIDDMLKFGSTSCKQDAYELTRQEKISLIAESFEKNKKYFQIKACFSPINGANCCKCEKCMRTIMAIKAVNGNPADYGFNVSNETYCEIKGYLDSHILYHTEHWNNIKKAFQKNKKLFQADKNVNWILNYTFNNPKIYISLAINKIKRILKGM